MSPEQKKRELLRRVERLKEQLVSLSAPLEPVVIYPWLSIVDIDQFLAVALRQAQDLAESKPLVGFPVTNAPWEDFIKILEIVEDAARSALPQTHA